MALLGINAEITDNVEKAKDIGKGKIPENRITPQLRQAPIQGPDHRVRKRHQKYRSGERRKITGVRHDDGITGVDRDNKITDIKS